MTDKKSNQTKNINVLLINPPRHKIQDPYDHGNGVPSLGLAYLGGVLLENGIEPVCIDAKFEKLNYTQLEKKIQSLGYVDIAGITAMTHNIKDAHDSAKIIRQYYPNARIVIGGCHVTALPKETLLEFECFDIAVIGEGEKTFPDLVRTILEKKDLAKVKGIAFRSHDTITTTSAQEPIRELDTIPFPAWNLFPQIGKKLILFTSRGCPFNCNFCSRVFGKQVRYRSAENVIAEINHAIDRYKITTIDFQDETFTLNKKRLQKLLSLMKSHGIDKKITWSPATRVDVVDKNILAMMKNAGCNTIGFGIESGNEEILKNSGKGITKAQVRESIKEAKNLGLGVNTGFIFGHPGETVQTVNDTIRFAAELNPTSAVFGTMVPYPGTKIRDMMLKGEGGYRLLSNDWNDYGKNVGHVMELTTLPKEKLMQLQLKAYVYFYLVNFRLYELWKFFWKNKKTALAVFLKLISKDS